jgi:carbon-monoxide dehydrogenase medium subunit
VTGAGSNGVFRVNSFEEALGTSFDPKAIEGLAVDPAGLNTDIHADADYRAHLINVLARRAVAAAK